MRTVGICGHDFCGSTLLSRLFAAVPSVASGGELRWLIDDPAERGKCCICGDSCSVFTQKMRKGLTQDNLYSKVANAFGKDILVSSDKGWNQFERFVKSGSMTGIVLYRTVHGVASSDKKHQTVWPIVKRNTVEASLACWIRVYSKLVSWSEMFCNDVVFLSYEDLVSDHVAVMTALCSRLNIPLSGDFPSGQLIDDYHNILGNPSAHGSCNVNMDLSWKKRLSSSEISFLSNNKKAMLVYESLKKRSFRIRNTGASGY